MPLLTSRLKIGALVGALLVAAGLAVGLDTRPAAAAPGTPILLSVEATSPTSVRIHWRDTADDETYFVLRQLRPATEYNIHVNWSPALSGRGAEESKEFRGLVPNTEYCFQMIAFDDGFFGAGLSDYWSGVKCGTTPPASTRATPPAPASIAAPLPPGLRERPQPDAPADFTGTLTESGTRIVLSWTAAEGATRYELRGANEDSGLVFTKTLHKDTTSYADEIGANQSGDFVYELQACAAVCSAPVTVTVAVHPQDGP